MSVPANGMTINAKMILSGSLAYNRAYKTHYARYLKKKMTTAQFEQWSRYAVELRQKAENGEMELADYQRQLRI